MRHTEGPWEFTEVHVYCYDDTRDEVICRLDGQEVNPAFLTQDDDQRTANARLIAAAPDLLAALEGLVEQLGDLLSRYNLEDYTALDAAHAAIARAKGGQ